MISAVDVNEVRIETAQLDPSEAIPNSPLAVLVYRGVLAETPADQLANAFEALFEANEWRGVWRNGIFPFHHYHSSAHEVLGIYSGRASVLFGGPHGVAFDIGPGDVVMIPAGVGHKRLSVRGRLGVVGAYPGGQSPDTCRSGEGADNVPGVPLPDYDPVYGKAGPIFEHWS